MQAMSAGDVMTGGRDGSGVCCGAVTTGDRTNETITARTIGMSTS
jgi:hypothetical protein